MSEPDTRSRILNERPRPRMLLLADGALITPELAERLSEVVPTVEIASSASRYNLREWDCIIQRGTTAFVNSEPSGEWTHDPKTIYEWGYYYPSGVCVLTVVPTLEYAWNSDDFFLGVSPADGKGEDLPNVAVMGQNGTVGSHLALPGDLDPELQRLVHRELIHAVEQRSFHRTVMRGAAEGAISDALRLRPFLLGPDDEVLAGSFDRDESTSIWFVPSDVPDLFPWAVAALVEWHARFPKRFPAVRDWGSASAWQTAEETALTAQLASNEAWFEEQYREFERQEKELTAKLETATKQASVYERALLTADGDDLVDAVACVLAELGFHVIDMDEHWPEGQRKEDLRVLDDDAPGWIALVEIKGFTSGVKETGFTSLVRWGQFYVQETGQLPGASWYVANGFRRDDPSSRPEPYAGRDDALDVVEEAGGLVIDTRALFDLLRIVRDAPSCAAAARKMLRDRRRRLTRVAATGVADDSGV